MNGDEYNASERAGTMSLGSFSQTTGYQQRKSPAALCPRAVAYLEQTGLMYRGAEVLG